MNKEVIFGNKFRKHYSERIIPNKSLLRKAKERIQLFYINPKNPILRNHKLQGHKNLLRSFSITGDHRIIYQEYPDHYDFLDIGTHNQVY